jgi:hypothetical protein
VDRCLLPAAFHAAAALDAEEAPDGEAAEAPDAAVPDVGAPDGAAAVPDAAVLARVLAEPEGRDVRALPSASVVPGRLEQPERAPRPATPPPKRSDCTRSQRTGSCSQKVRIS